MNIILVEGVECNGNFVELTDHRATHIVKILKTELGGIVKIGVVDGMMGTARILDITRKRPHKVSLEMTLTKSLSPLPRIDLVLALPRPIMLRRILSQVTAQGIGHIHLINANRVEKSFWDASIIDPADYREHLVIGLEQCVDTRLPTVSFHKKFRPFVEDYLPANLNNYSHCILADPSGDMAIKHSLNTEAERVLLAVGPEGGWVDFEVEKFREQGFDVCTIGERILKVDTAVIALHGHISALMQ